MKLNHSNLFLKLQETSFVSNVFDFVLNPIMAYITNQSSAMVICDVTILSSDDSEHVSGRAVSGVF